MSALEFSLKLPSRADNTPGTDGYTYHHVLPWRYFFLTGQILARYAKLRVAKTEEVFGSATLQTKLAGVANAYLGKNGKADDKLVATEFGKSFDQFVRDTSASPNLSAKEAIDLCAKMHGDAVATGFRRTLHGDPKDHNADAGNSIRTILNTGGFDFDQIGNHCGAPKFGGFLGPAPEKRSDDPKDAPEPVCPVSFDNGRWASLALLRAVLDASCKGIGSASAGTSLSVSITDQDFGLFVGYLQGLIGQHNGSAAPFAPGDWAVNKTDWLWVDPPTGAVPKPGNIGAIFALRTAAVTGQGTRVAFAALPAPDARPKLYQPVTTNRKDFKFFAT